MLIPDLVAVINNPIGIDFPSAVHARHPQSGPVDMNTTMETRVKAERGQHRLLLAAVDWLITCRQICCEFASKG